MRFFIRFGLWAFVWLAVTAVKADDAKESASAGSFADEPTTGYSHYFQLKVNPGQSLPHEVLKSPQQSANSPGSLGSGSTIEVEIPSSFADQNKKPEDYSLQDFFKRIREKSAARRADHEAKRTAKREARQAKKAKTLARLVSKSSDSKGSAQVGDSIEVNVDDLEKKGAIAISGADREYDDHDEWSDADILNFDSSAVGDCPNCGRQQSQNPAPITAINGVSLGPTLNNADLAEAIRGYSMSKNVERMIMYAKNTKVQSRYRNGLCLRGVEFAIAEGGNFVSSKASMPQDLAKNAGRDLARCGFTNLLDNAEFSEKFSKPADAPLGAIIVYNAPPGVAGHVEIRTSDGFVYSRTRKVAYTGNRLEGTFSTPSRRRKGDSGWRKVIGVWIKPKPDDPPSC